MTTEQTNPRLELYNSSTRLRVPPVGNAEHTMSADELLRYVTGKFDLKQKRVIDECLSLKPRVPIEVHAAYLSDFEELVESKGETLVGRWMKQPRKDKLYCNIRPTLCEIRAPDGKRRLCLVTFPSPEYGRQFAELLSQLLWYRCQEEEELGDYREEDYPILVLYPDCSRHAMEWTGFEAGIKPIVSGDEIVVLGEIATISDYLEQWGAVPVAKDEAFGLHGIFGYTLLRFLNTNRRVLLIGVRHSYWGSTAGQLAEALGRAGASHIIYAAKAGTFQHDTYRHKATSPMAGYLLLDDGRGGEPARKPINLPSKLHANYRPLTSLIVEGGQHLSVPTVVGETQEQRKHYRDSTPSSVDNEVAHMAAAIQAYNSENDCEVNFTVLHFLTDYLHREDEEAKFGPGLGDKVDSSPDLKSSKARNFGIISSIIATFAMHEGARHVDEKGLCFTAAQDWDDFATGLEALARKDRNPAPGQDTLRLLAAIWGAAYAWNGWERLGAAARGIVKRFEKKSYSLVFAAELCVVSSEMSRLWLALSQATFSREEVERDIKVFLRRLELLEAAFVDYVDRSHSNLVYHRAVLAYLMGQLLAGAASLEPPLDTIASREVNAAAKLDEARAFIDTADASSEDREIWKASITRALAGNTVDPTRRRELFAVSQSSWDRLITERLALGDDEKDKGTFLEVELALSRLEMLVEDPAEARAEIWLESAENLADACVERPLLQSRLRNRIDSIRRSRSEISPPK